MSKRGIAYFGSIPLVFAVALGCPASEAPSGDSGFGGVGGAGSGGGGAGAIGGMGGAASIGGISGTGGNGGTDGNSGAGGDAASGGTGGGGVATGANRVTAGQWCARLAEIQCAGEASCCNDDARKHGSTGECEAGQRNLCENTFQVATIGSDARVAYDLDRAEQSLTTFESKTRQCAVDAAAWGASPEGLITMFAGTKGAGESCSPTSMTDYAAGASCTRGLTCIPTSALLLSWTCSPPSTAGGPCFADINCTPGLHCEEPESRSTCVGNLSNGASCDRPTQCASLFCEDGQCVEASVNAGYCFRR